MPCLESSGNLEQLVLRTYIRVLYKLSGAEEQRIIPLNPHRYNMYSKRCQDIRVVAMKLSSCVLHVWLLCDSQTVCGQTRTLQIMVLQYKSECNSIHFFGFNIAYTSRNASEKKEKIWFTKRKNKLCVAFSRKYINSSDF